MSLLRSTLGSPTRSAYVALLITAPSLLAAGLMAPLKNAWAAETILYSFGRHARDGWTPRAGLLQVGDPLYGTTYSGGDGGGAVFSATLKGNVTFLYQFSGAPMAAAPSQV